MLIDLIRLTLFTLLFMSFTIIKEDMTLNVCSVYWLVRTFSTMACTLRPVHQLLPKLSLFVIDVYGRIVPFQTEVFRSQTWQELGSGFGTVVRTQVRIKRSAFYWAFISCKLYRYVAKDECKGKEADRCTFKNRARTRLT